jgi:predicted outer membrane repeat protein
VRRGAAGLLAGLLLARAAPAGAAVFVVGNTNDSGAGSLRDAITSANGAAGADEISFMLGCPCAINLASSLVVTDALTITGLGADRLAIDGGNAVRVLQATAPLTLVDLTIRNGNAGAGDGGAIQSTGPGASLTLTRVAIETCSGVEGGGVHTQVPTVVTDSVFEGNTASMDGGGLYAPGGITMTGSQFVNNRVTAHKAYGGGGGLMAFGPTTISTTSFIGNFAGDWGGGAYLADFTPMSLTLLADLQFHSNVADDGGGGGLFVWFDAVLTEVDASDNAAGYRGGGIYAGYAGNYGIQVSGGSLLHNSAAGGGGFYSDGDFEMDGTTLIGNTSTNGNGGGAWTPGSAVASNLTISDNIVLAGGNSGGFDTGANLTLSGSTLSNNRTYTGAGGGSGAGGNATVSDCEYTGNTADGLGGGLLAFGNVQVTDSTFSGNTAEHNWGGGVFGNQITVTGTTFSGNTSSYAGGGLGSQFGAIQVTGGRFEGNQAVLNGWGGGIYGGVAVTVDGTEFEANVAELNGGAITASGALSVTGALLRGNSAAANGGAIYAAGDLDLDRVRGVENEADLGGAVFQGGGGGEITNSLFARNRALSGRGEALALQPAAVQSVRHSTLATYPTQAAGSALYVNGGTVELESSILVSHALGIERDAAGIVNADFNLFDGNGADTQGASITNGNPVAGPPGFVDPANGNFHLAFGSAALDAGPDVGVATDLDGETRPKGAGFDLGFDELDPAAPAGCPATPVSGCRAAESDTLQIKVAADPAKNRFTLKHSRDTAALAPADFGDPVAGGNVYQLCLYDESAGVPALLATLTVPGGGTCGSKACWKASSKGFQFKDGAASHDGVQQIALKTGDAGKGSVQVKGAGAGLPLPGPKTAGMPYLSADPGVTAQLHESSTGGCFESRVEAGDVQKNTEAQFKAVRK